jgi:hypothetical protein
MTDDLRPDVRDYLNRNPDATAAALAGNTGVEPARAKEAIAEHTPPATADSGPWDGVDWSDTATDEYPPALVEREQWMGRREGTKLPFSPWGDANAPVECRHNACPKHDGHTPECDRCELHREGCTRAECHHDARYSWSASTNYVNGVKAGMGEADDRLGGRLFIQQEADPFAFVDGDDVRDPETGDVHPRFVALLNRLGHTYADVSTSGSGVHAYYRGDLPGGTEATFEIDTEPFGTNDTPPAVEIYSGKHVNVTTGDHLRDTPDDVAEWDSDELVAVLDEYDTEPAGGTADAPAADVAALMEYDDTPEDDTDELGAGVTDDMEDIFRALDALEPGDVRLRTDCVGSEGTGWTLWDPSTYRSTGSGESLHRAPDGPFYDQKEARSFGTFDLFAAERGFITHPWDDLEGEDWRDAVDEAREAGAPIPEYVDRDPDDAAGKVAQMLTD